MLVAPYLSFTPVPNDSHLLRREGVNANSTLPVIYSGLTSMTEEGVDASSALPIIYSGLTSMTAEGVKHP